MQDKIKDAFDEIAVNDARIAKTQHAVLSSMHAPQRKAPRYNKWTLVIVAMACLLFTASSSLLYFTPTAVVSVDINPSLELEINRFDRVLDVNGYNDDGVVLAQSLDLAHKTVDDAMTVLLESDGMQEYMTNDGELTIAVVPTRDATQGEALIEVVSRCTQAHKNTHCYTMNSSAHHEAHAVGLSCGRYHAYQALVQAGATITPEEMNAMSMKEIREMMVEYGAGDVVNGDSGCGQGNGAHGHHGHHHGCKR